MKINVKNKDITTTEEQTLLELLEIEKGETIQILDLCEECGEPLIPEGRCSYCYNCGWSKCNV